MVPGIDVWACVFIWRAMGSKTFSTEISDSRIQSKRGLLSTGCATRIVQSKKFKSKKYFSKLCEKPIGPQSERAFFDGRTRLYKNGLTD